MTVQLETFALQNLLNISMVCAVFLLQQQTLKMCVSLLGHCATCRVLSIFRLYLFSTHQNIMWFLLYQQHYRFSKIVASSFFFLICRHYLKD